MKKFRHSIVLILLMFALAGCAAGSGVNRVGACSGKSFNQLLEATDLKPLFNDLALELCTEPSKTEPGRSTAETRPEGKCSSSAAKTDYSVLVTDFVDIQTFAPATQGLLMGELMRGSLNSVCCTKITQVEFAKFFNLNEKGLIVLSRKVSEIKNDDYDQNEAIVGTYSYLNNKIVLFARKINVVTGKISRMAMREVDYNCAGGVVSYRVK
jgi:FlgO protein